MYIVYTHLREEDLPRIRESYAPDARREPIIQRQVGVLLVGFRASGFRDSGFREVRDLGFQGLGV